MTPDLAAQSLLFLSCVAAWAYRKPLTIDAYGDGPLPEFRTSRTGIEFGRYRDTLRHEDGTWRFVRRAVEFL